MLKTILLDLGMETPVFLYLFPLDIFKYIPCPGVSFPFTNASMLEIYYYGTLSREGLFSFGIDNPLEGVDIRLCIEVILFKLLRDVESSLIKGSFLLLLEKDIPFS